MGHEERPPSDTLDKPLPNHEIYFVAMMALRKKGRLSSLDDVSDEASIRFTWRANRYKVDAWLVADVVEGGLLGRTNEAELMSLVLEAALRSMNKELSRALP